MTSLVSYTEDVHCNCKYFFKANACLNDGSNGLMEIEDGFDE